MSKIRLGKTADSRIRGKTQQSETPNTTSGFINYLLKKGYSNRTSITYREDLGRFMRWLEKEHTPIEEVGYTDILHYVQSMRGRVAQRTISSSVNSIRHYFNYLIEKGEATDNPGDQIQIKGVKRNRMYDILEPLELDQLYHKFITTRQRSGRRPTTSHHKLKDLEHQRDIVMLGLLIYQGVAAQELIKLQPTDIKLRQGIIELPAGRKSNSRELKLEAVQILDMQEYLLRTRDEILQATQKESAQLFISIGTSNNLYNSLHKFTATIRKLSGLLKGPKIQDLHQIRASVIVKWLNNYNLRQVQYMAGHRFVSSTEKYRLNDLKDLQEDINKYHPLQ